jgi:hypothetical protein
MLLLRQKPGRIHRRKFYQKPPGVENLLRLRGPDDPKRIAGGVEYQVDRGEKMRIELGLETARDCWRKSGFRKLECRPEGDTPFVVYFWWALGFWLEILVDR